MVKRFYAKGDSTCRLYVFDSWRECMRTLRKCPQFRTACKLNVNIFARRLLNHQMKDCDCGRDLASDVALHNAYGILYFRDINRLAILDAQNVSIWKLICTVDAASSMSRYNNEWGY